MFCVLLVRQGTCTSVCNYSIVQKQLLLVTCYARFFPKRMNAINKFYIINANSQSSFKYTFNSISTKNELNVSGTSQNVLKIFGLVINTSRGNMYIQMLL